MMTLEQAEALIHRMEQNADILNVVPLTISNWLEMFGKDCLVQTPIGIVKIGDNQYIKLINKNRQKEFGMIKPTLTNPDVIIKKNSPQDGTERNYKLLFIKIFLANHGKKYVNFESVTIKKDRLEISISNHILEKKAMLRELTRQNIAFIRSALNFNNSEWYLAETH
ncbi:MAG: hypothetical protein LBQ31_07930 [Bacteroidales bacterium]|jgi:hypothetical protein|nr:hypothetical protein [Bacteroidales bacterium]